MISVCTFKGQEKAKTPLPGTFEDASSGICSIVCCPNCSLFSQQIGVKVESCVGHVMCPTIFRRLSNSAGFPCYTVYRAIDRDIRDMRIYIYTASLSMSTHMYIHIVVYIYIYICMYGHIFVFTRIYKYIYIYIHFFNAHISLSLYIFTYNIQVEVSRYEGT